MREKKPYRVNVQRLAVKRSHLAISKRGSGQARWYLFMAALRLIQREPVVRAWHESKRARDGGGIGLRSVVGIMRKLAKALWHMARGHAFDASKLFHIRRLALSGQTQGTSLGLPGVATLPMHLMEDGLASS